MSTNLVQYVNFEPVSGDDDDFDDRSGNGTNMSSYQTESSPVFFNNSTIVVGPWE
jgi:hypothetical protein